MNLTIFIPWCGSTYFLRPLDTVYDDFTRALFRKMGGSKILGQYLTRGLLGFILWLGYIEYQKGLR